MKLDIFNSTTRKVIIISAVVFAILAVITGIFWTDAQFNWFFDSINYWAGCVILSLALLSIWIVTGGERRTAKLYITSNGNLDFSTPRIYTRLKKSKAARFLGSVAWWTSLTLEQFEFENGKVRIQNTKGDTIEGLVKDLTVRRSFTKDRSSGEYYPYKYIITNPEGDNIKFYVNHSAFEEEEWNDMHMILEQAGTLNEPKTSKFARKSDKILSKLQDFDFSDIPGGIIELTVDTVAVKANGYVSSVIKKRLVKKNGKNSKWLEVLKQIKDWTLYILLLLYILAVIVYNIVTFPAWNHSKDEIASEYETSLYEEEYTDYDETETDTESSESTIYHLTGLIDGKYSIDMTLDVKNGTGSYFYVKSGSGQSLSLIITQLDEDGNIVIEEYNDNDEQTGLFEGRINNDGEIQGWFTNYKGKEMPFHLEID